LHRRLTLFALIFRLNCFIGLLKRHLLIRWPRSNFTHVTLMNIRWLTYLLTLLKLSPCKHDFSSRFTRAQTETGESVIRKGIHCETDSF